MNVSSVEAIVDICSEREGIWRNSGDAVALVSAMDVSVLPLFWDAHTTIAREIQTFLLHT
jgi:hypothetical protein